MFLEEFRQRPGIRNAEREIVRAILPFKVTTQISSNKLCSPEGKIKESRYAANSPPRGKKRQTGAFHVNG